MNPDNIVEIFTTKNTGTGLRARHAITTPATLCQTLCTTGGKSCLNKQIQKNTRNHTT